MNPDMQLLLDIENQLLELADEQQDMDRSDFQGRCSVVARKIILQIEQGVAAKIEKLLEGKAIKLIEALEELQSDLE